jgi:aminoglycoside phosphotransferase (APT) family kinase protein
VTASQEPVPAPPDPALVAWALEALAPSPGGHGVSCVGMREGGSPWRIERNGAPVAVLKVVPAGPGAALATEVAALELAGAHGLPVPRVLAADVAGTVAPGCAAVVTAVLPGTSRVPSAPPSPERFRRLGELAAAIHRVPAPAPSAELPVREHPIPDVDFAALRRAAERRPLLVAAEESLADAPLPQRPPVFLHGDLWQGNTLWASQDDGAAPAGVVDWDGAGVGPAGIDVGSLRCDAWMSAGREAAAAVLAGYEEAAGRPADDLAYWDVVAALSTPPTIDWFVAAIRDQGRYDLDQPTLLIRRDAFLRDALHRLG